MSELIYAVWWLSRPLLPFPLVTVTVGDPIVLWRRSAWRFKRRHLGRFVITNLGPLERVRWQLSFEDDKNYWFGPNGLLRRRR